VRLRSLAIVVALATILTACGIPVGSQPSVVNSHDVPFHLLSPVAPTSTTTTEPAVTYVPESIYLLGANGAVVVVQRDVAFPATLDAVVTSLIAGPTTQEVAAGFTTALPSTGKVLSTSLTGSVATLNLSTAFGQIGGASETVAVGQLVLTTTSQPGITAVSFEINGNPISVPTANGAVTAQPVTAAQYQTLLG
jgi:spore germination protein GerM